MRRLLRALLIWFIAGVLPLHAAVAGAVMLVPAAPVTAMAAAHPCHEAAAAPGDPHHVKSSCAACAFCCVLAALPMTWDGATTSALRHAFVTTATIATGDFVTDGPQRPPRRA